MNRELKIISNIFCISSLIQHLLRSPCELRIAAALAANNRNRDIYRGTNELLNGDSSSTPILIETNDDDTRFKRQIPVRSDS